MINPISICVSILICLAFVSDPSAVLRARGWGWTILVGPMHAHVESDPVPDGFGTEEAANMRYRALPECISNLCLNLRTSIIVPY